MVNPMSRRRFPFPLGRAIDSILQFDVTHAYLVVFAAVLLDVIALPLLAVPVLVMARGSCSDRESTLLFIISCATVAAAAGEPVVFARSLWESSIDGSFGENWRKKTGVPVSQYR
jgi:hypothetical protein